MSDEKRGPTNDERTERFVNSLKDYAQQPFEDKDREVLAAALAHPSVLKAFGRLYSLVYDQPLQFLQIRWEEDGAVAAAADLTGSIRGRMEALTMLYSLTLQEETEDE